ncbi:MAG: hypothetical protein GQ529_00825, partial [Methyloprofundus sp.]|nr:hypothetical protein [Methyloprofundus sp.]
MILIHGCASQRTIDVEPQSLLNADRELADEQLFDVGIVVFEPGLVDDDELLIPEVRKAEARFIPVHLRNTLQQSGNWGAVRVIPENIETLDLIINGTILESDGEVLSLRIIARDATGKVWLNNIYKDKLTNPTASQDNLRGKKDAFQDMYNAIANDLLLIRNQQSYKQIQNIHRVALLRFAQNLAQNAFSAYVVEDKNKLLEAIRMPADNDPMFIRVQKIQAREAMLIDTIDSYYDHFYNEMWDSYAAWRNNHREEMIVYREIQKKAYTRYALGAVAIAGAVALAV